MNGTPIGAEGTGYHPNIAGLEPVNPSAIQIHHNKDRAIYAPIATNTTPQVDSFSITCGKKDFRKCITIVQWILIFYCVAAVSYLLISSTNRQICSCSDNNVEQMLVTNTSTTAPIKVTTSTTTTAAPTASITSTTAAPQTPPATSTTSSSSVTASGSISSHGIIQAQRTISHTKVSVSSTGWVEPSEDYRVSITPKYADSDIYISYHFGWNGYGIAVNTLVTWSAAKSVGSSSMSIDNITSVGAASSRNAISGVVQRRNNGYDENDPNFAYWTTVDSPATTEMITYGLKMQIEAHGAGSVRIGESLGYDSSGSDPRWPWSMPVVITAMEIRNAD